jgi:hypothetical protein
MALELTTADKQKFLEYMEKKRLSGGMATKKSVNYFEWLIDDIIVKLKEDSVLDARNKAEIVKQKFRDSLMIKILQDSMSYAMDNEARIPDPLFERSLEEAEDLEEAIFLMNLKAQKDLDFAYILNKAFCLSYIEQAQHWGVKPDEAIVALLFNQY